MQLSTDNTLFFTGNEMIHNDILLRFVNSLGVEYGTYKKNIDIPMLEEEIREYFDVVVIRGQWDSTLSAPISNAYQELLTISDKISEIAFFKEDRL